MRVVRLQAVQPVGQHGLNPALAGGASSRRRSAVPIRLNPALAGDARRHKIGVNGSKVQSRLYGCFHFRSDSLSLNCGPVPLVRPVPAFLAPLAPIAVVHAVGAWDYSLRCGFSWTISWHPGGPEVEEQLVEVASGRFEGHPIFLMEVDDPDPHVVVVFRRGAVEIWRHWSCLSWCGFQSGFGLLGEPWSLQCGQSRVCG